MNGKVGIEVKGVVNLEEIGKIEDKKSADQEILDIIIDKYECEKDALISILIEVEKEYNCLPENALEYVAERLDMPISKVKSKAKQRKKAGKMAVEYYPTCSECGTRLTDEPFTDRDTVVMQSFTCPKCEKEQWVYIDLEKLSRRKNKWCPKCRIYTRNYTDDLKCPICGSEVYRTKSRTNKERAVEYYPRCPECDKVLTSQPFTDIETVCMVELYCPECDKSHWCYINLEKMFKA